ncbi:MAG: dephospho-CoA kinase [Actinobacteria bacterium]|nr:MAG: dephospho-CoA kinase [Actinomycetota bacterium]
MALPAWPSGTRSRKQRDLSSRTESASRKPLAVAVTGGIGAGKTEALAAFARHGAATISSDEVVHELYDEDQVRSALRERFGDSVFAADGSVDRAAVGELVFGSPDELLWLEGLLHPLVMARTEAWREELSRRPEPPVLAVNEVPLLYETGSENRFDAVVAITAPRGLRAERAGERLDEREERLIPDEEKLLRADFAYVNEGSLEELDDFVAQVVRALSAR